MIAVVATAAECDRRAMWIHCMAELSDPKRPIGPFRPVNSSSWYLLSPKENAAPRRGAPPRQDSRQPTAAGG